MKLHRFFGDFDLSEPRIRLSGALAHQIKDVLRMKVGDELVLCDGMSNEAHAEIAVVKKTGIELILLKTYTNTSEPFRSVTLYAASLKKENFETVVMKATEIGVAHIVPLVSKRTIKLNMKRDRLEKIIQEAAEQSGRGIVPQLHDVLSFNEALGHAEKSNKENILFHPEGKRVHMYAQSKQVGIFVGPEGGWSPDEVDRAREKKFVIASLGLLTLRAETAAIIAAYELCKE